MTEIRSHDSVAKINRFIRQSKAFTTIGSVAFFKYTQKTQYNERSSTGWATLLISPGKIYRFKVNITNTRKRRKMCLKLT